MRKEKREVKRGKERNDETPGKEKRRATTERREGKGGERDGAIHYLTLLHLRAAP